MTRTTADALALVNWKGVFYARYGLDRHVTALEGANGSGKTTVMIGAYVVLLPDMSRLRFTNLGETGATGGDKGIWGRLGDQNRPSYAAIDFGLPGKRRLVAGVHLERKGEPSIEPTPFIVAGLDPDVRLQDLLLIKQGGSEMVPELTELRENAARLGGRLQSFTSARDYFSALFDQGVTPLRLGTDEERTKLNEMLRTSMTGGISRALTSELRSFLLKEEGGLADTLHRMRANLDACRRTRTEVHEARRLEHEIAGVFEAGQTMFTAALLATRERAEELGRRVEEAEHNRLTAARVRDTVRHALEQTLDELDALGRRRAEIGQLLESARERHGTLRDALTAAGRVASCWERLARAQSQARKAEEHRDAADAARGRARDELRRAQDGDRRAAAGLADLQAGIEELHRRAGGYLQATRRLHEAREALGGVTMMSLAECGTRAREELDAVDRERRDATTRHADAEAHRARHAQVMTALQLLIGDVVDAAGAHDAALSALQVHRDRVALARRLPTLERDLEEARKLTVRQAAARERAQRMGIDLGNESAGPLVERLLADAERELTEQENRARAAEVSARQAQDALRELEARRRDLAETEPAYRDLAARATRLAQHLATPVASRTGLDAARAAIDLQLSLARKEEHDTGEEHESLLRQARALLAQGGPLDPSLLALKDQLGAELVSESFEDVGLEEAGRVEARLGPLVHALVVDDPRFVARTLGSRPESIADVLLVSRDTDLDVTTGSTSATEVAEGDIAVDEGLALRISRVRSNPRLGRHAREARAAELRTLADAKLYLVEAARTRRNHLQRLVGDGEALLAGHAVWLAGDPASQLAATKRAISETEAQLAGDRQAVVRHDDSAKALRPRVSGLRAILVESLLLDPPDHGERSQALEVEFRAATTAKDMVTRHERSAETVDRHQADLRLVPLTENEIADLAKRMLDLKDHRERLQSGLDSLDYVQANVEALGWEDAPKRLDHERALVPALTVQLEEAAALVVAAEAKATYTEAQLDDAVGTFHDADGERRLANGAYVDALEGFNALGIPAPTEAEVVAAAAHVTRLDEEHRSHDGRHAALLIAKGRQEGELGEATRRFDEADEKLARERVEAEPAAKRWSEFRERASQLGLIGNLLVEPPMEFVDVRGHVNLVQRAQSGRAILLERLKTAHGATTLMAELQVLRVPPDGEFAAGVLDLWVAVRDWLRKRLPAQIAEVDDPREALLRLRQQLSSLEDRLVRQESDLRGESENVARGIDVHVRKARTQVNRLNKNLEGVSFGSIQGIRVRQHQVERMEQVLRALREGAAQGLLFQAEMPLEEALDEVFRQFGGGRTGGSKLLDYREYIHLQVEIRRKVGTDWETANPGRLSTGEAIGVGAALMMVVLTEWERDATALRGKKSHGSLRFLFLDEANRLSHDNLGVLFDLCQILDLQLLIAAPEVARAEGNTTYRLVRKVSADGREEVLVTGRRTRLEA